MIDEQTLKNEEIRAVEKVLGKPFGLDLQENALKIRRNLLAVACIAIGLVATNAKIERPSLSGITLLNLDDRSIKVALACALLYFLVHFVWYVVEAFGEWRLRLTGTRVAFTTGARAGSELADYPDDPRQSTLYNWWSEEARKIGGIVAAIHEVERLRIVCGERVNELLRENPQQQNGRDLTGALVDLKLNGIDKIPSKVDAIEKLLASRRIFVSLNRFDNWFAAINDTANLRWIFIEATFPIALGVAALIVVLMSV